MASSSHNDDGFQIFVKNPSGASEEVSDELKTKLDKVAIKADDAITGQTITLNVKASNTINDVKDILKDKKAFTPDQQDNVLLIYKGKQAEGGDTIGAKGI